jgi:hypothetical protein
MVVPGNPLVTCSPNRERMRENYELTERMYCDDDQPGPILLFESLP